MKPVLRIQRLSHADALPLPAYESAGAAGMDLRAAVPEDAPLTLAPGARQAVPTGMIFEIPEGFEGQVRPRSGLALNHGITCLNSPGTIDCDYRGEVKVILANLGAEAFTVTRSGASVVSQARHKTMRPTRLPMAIQWQIRLTRAWGIKFVKSSVLGKTQAPVGLSGTNAARGRASAGV